MGRIARFGLCLIMAGVALYGLLGLISAAEAASDSAHTNTSHSVPLVIGNDMASSLAPYIGGGLIPMAAAGLYFAYRKHAVDDNYSVKTKRIEE